MFDEFTHWLKEAFIDLLSWFNLEQQKMASFLYPTLKKADAIVKSGALEDIINLIPELAQDIAAREYAELFEHAKQLVKDVVSVYDLALEKTDVAILANTLIAQAQDAATRVDKPADPA